MAVFPARYQGRCAGCEERIFEGDFIEMVDGKAVHADCIAAAPVERPEPPVCTDCWLVHPVGACDR